MTAHDLQSEGVREQIGTANLLQSVGQALHPTPAAKPLGATVSNKDGWTDLALVGGGLDHVVGSDRGPSRGGRYEGGGRRRATRW
ncbi:MAG: hypothetical protein P8Y93_03910 [Acidobacteriota bacterium]